MQQPWRSLLPLLCVVLLTGLFSVGPWGATELTARAQPRDSAPLSTNVPVEPPRIDVLPALPSATEPLQVRVAGVWSDGCVPYGLSHEVTATAIVIVAATPEPEVVCGQSTTPWTIEIDLGRLPANNYEIEVRGAVAARSTVAVMGTQVYLPLIGG